LREKRGKKKKNEKKGEIMSGIREARFEAFSRTSFEKHSRKSMKKGPTPLQRYVGRNSGTV